jgi:glycosyltransferase involved in cell wall biosynthesis
MEVVFVDPEPPDPGGGGIRTYLRLALSACRENGCAARIYTHNPLAYPGENSVPIGRKPWLRGPWRGAAYRWLYTENVLWEQSHWLASELAACDSPDTVYEFADFLGYGFFALRDQSLRDRVIVRVHTPNFLVAAATRGLRGRLAAWLGAWRERDCLARASHITVPSAEFVREKMPWLRNWTHIPNPLPPESAALERRIPAANDAIRFLYLGRIEPRKGVMVLVKAFLRLAAIRPETTLTLVGGSPPGKYADEVRALIDSQPPDIRARLSWEPPCPADRKPALFARFDVLAAPSLWENSPYVYFEGMAAGLLCAGSATGEIKSVTEITKSPSARPGDEEDWLRLLSEVAAGKGREALPAQAEYLRERRKAIPGRLVDHYRLISGGAAGQ